jgi:hypothetical protein
MTDIRPADDKTIFFQSDRFYYSSFALNLKKDTVNFFGRAYSFVLTFNKKDPMVFELHDNGDGYVKLF